MKALLANREKANIPRRLHSFKANMNRVGLSNAANSLMISKGTPLKKQCNDRRTGSRRVSAQKLYNCSKARWPLLASCSQSEGNEKLTPEKTKESHKPVGQIAPACVDGEVIIHVCDDNKKVTKNFICNKERLLSHMKFFNRFKAEGTKLEDLDISIHCDINIFEWLMLYLHNPSTQKLSIKSTNVVSILISSEHLQMESLIKECIEYIVKHIRDILSMSINSSCISTSLIKQIAHSVSIKDLDLQTEEKGSLTSRLYMEKTEMLLEEPGNLLSRCVYCNQFFCLSHVEKLKCQKSNPFIGFHGEIISLHVPDKAWNNKRFISYLRQQCNLTWHDIYWKIWARLNVFRCSVCDQWFTPAFINFCLSHPSPVRYIAGNNYGTYNCCGTQTIRFNAEPNITGCTATQHTFYEDTSNSMLINTIKQKLPVIAEASTLKGVLEKNNSSHSLQALTEGYVEQYREFLEEPCSDNESDTNTNKDKFNNENKKMNRMVAKKVESLSLKRQRKWRLYQLQREDEKDMEQVILEVRRMRGEEERIGQSGGLVRTETACETPSVIALNSRYIHC